MADNLQKPCPTPPPIPSGRAWSRRDLLIRGGQAVVIAGAAACAARILHDPIGDAGLQPPKPMTLKDYFAQVEFPTSSPRVSVAFGRPELIDDLDHIQRMLTSAITSMHPDGMKAFVAKGDVVMLKPNVGFGRDPRLGATTNPQVVRAVIRLCREAGARKIIVADNPIENPPACFAKSGIRAAAEAEGVTVAIYSTVDDATVQIRTETPDPTKGESLGTWPIFWKPLRDADKVIGIPVIKDHNLCSASMAMKNWYGLLSGRRNQFHQAIHNIISDLGYMMKPTLIVADGTRVMMSNGPTGGRLSDVAIGGTAGRPAIVASVDQLACDSWCYQKLLGRDPASVRYLELAYQKFGQDPSRIVAPHWQEYARQGKIVEVTTV